MTETCQNWHYNSWITLNNITFQTSNNFSLNLSRTQSQQAAMSPGILETWHFIPEMKMRLDSLLLMIWRLEMMIGSLQHSLSTLSPWKSLVMSIILRHPTSSAQFQPITSSIWLSTLNQPQPQPPLQQLPQQQQPQPLQQPLLQQLLLKDLKNLLL